MAKLSKLLFVLVGVVIFLQLLVWLLDLQQEKKSDFPTFSTVSWAAWSTTQEVDLEARYAQETREEKLNNTDLSQLTQQEADALVYAYFPSCESLYEYHEPLRISKHIQNCTKKPKKWSYPDGLGGGCFPWYMIDKKHGLLEMNSCGEVFEEGKILDHPYLCKSVAEGGRFSFGKPLWDEDPDHNFSFMSWAKQALQKGLALGFLDKVSPRYDIGRMRTLRNDPDTEIISERWAWSDEKGNYFVAGSRAYGNQIYFIINDTFYDPRVVGANLDGDFFEWESLSSNWLFGGFHGDVPLVKRILNYKKASTSLTGADSSDADYILETCELKL